MAEEISTTEISAPPEFEGQRRGTYTCILGWHGIASWRTAAFWFAAQGEIGEQRISKRERFSPGCGRMVTLLALLLGGGALYGEEEGASRKEYRKSLAHRALVREAFQGADLRDTDMKLTDFRGADLRGANFTNSSLDRARLADADLSGAVGLGAADFGLGVEAERASFRRADLRGARIPGRHFEGADFRAADLREAFLAGRFHRARFEGADVRGAVLLGATGIDPPVLADLGERGALVKAADVARAVRAGRDFAGSHFGGCDLANVRLDGAALPRSNLHSADLRGTSLCKAQCAEALVCWAKLQSADLREADLSGANLGGADLTGANLERAVCRGARFWEARLTGACLAGTDFTNADLRRADLTGADLSGTTLDGVRWDGAIVTNLRGVSPEQEAALRAQAVRWDYELKEGIDQLVRGGSVPVWLVSWAAGAVVLYRGRRRTRRRAWLKALTVLHGLAALPGMAFLLLLLTRAWPAVQLSGTLTGWSWWVALGPLALGAALLTLAAFLPLAVFAWVAGSHRYSEGRSSYVRAAMVLTGLALLSSAGCLIVLAPRT